MSIPVRFVVASMPDAMRPAFVRAYSDKLDVFVDTTNGGPGAKQSFRGECDINNIMAKYQRTGVVSWLNSREPSSIDLTGYDFREAMDVVAHAKATFADLPSSVRKRFGNDPSEFLLFMDDSANAAEAIKLGLATERVVEVPPEPLKVFVTDPTDSNK